MSLPRRHVLLLGSLLLANPLLARSVLGNPIPADADPAAGSSPPMAADSAAPCFFSAASDAAGRHWVRAFSVRNMQVQPVFAHELPARAHHVAIDPVNELYVVVARRPGTYLLVGDMRNGQILQQLQVPSDRHLLGHGVFSADGRQFYCVESDYENLQGDNGRLVTWEFRRDPHSSAAPLHARRVNDFPTHGVGPHELLLMPDQDTLVVANGGIRTHPESGRDKLNLATMQPSLVYLERTTGTLLERRQLAADYHQASIRHLAVNHTGLVALVMQYQGLPFENVPLVALHRRGQALSLPAVPLPVQQQMKQYCGSVRFDQSGRFIAVSCPRGNRITFWDAEQESFIDSVRSRDGCGVCALADGFLYTTGTGRIDFYEPRHRVSRALAGPGKDALFWDNHLTTVAGLGA